MSLTPDAALTEAIANLKEDATSLDTVVNGDENATITLENGYVLKSIRNILQTNATITDEIKNSDDSTILHITEAADPEAGAATLNNSLEITNGSITIQGSEVFHPGNNVGLDADLLDGQHGTYYTNADNLNAGTVHSDRISGSYNITNTGSTAKLTTARNIALSGDVTGNANFDGSANIDISTTLVATQADPFSENYFEGISSDPAGTSFTTSTVLEIYGIDVNEYPESDSAGIVADDANNGVVSRTTTTLTLEAGTYYIDAWFLFFTLFGTNINTHTSQFSVNLMKNGAARTASNVIKAGGDSYEFFDIDNGNTDNSRFPSPPLRVDGRFTLASQTTVEFYATEASDGTAYYGAGSESGPFTYEFRSRTKLWKLS